MRITFARILSTKALIKAENTIQLHKSLEMMRLVQPWHYSMFVTAREIKMRNRKGVIISYN